ncbi:MFS transporter [Acidithrix sp. C25]|uniref:MFS transporter n=1 Tax=Acidithrix sp. C25 TaxID=1671482 RepID=UPI00191BAD28|nr:MFS transporter [Acidithrix sp. C25]CAG4933146.1 unnamed protein product [Acidithrix sp. C25]
MREEDPILTNRALYIFSVTCGASVASTYYLQPIFPSVGRSLHILPATVSLVSTVLQLAYALGLLLVVPLGDLFDRRKLIPFLLGLSSLSLLGVALSPNFGLFLFFCALVGVTSVVAQITVGFVATIAEPARRGAQVGTVMSGLLMGILLARTISGTIDQFFGWRAIFVMGAIAVGALALVIAPNIATLPRSHQGGYGSLLGSLLVTFKSEPVVRQASLLGLLQFMAFSIFWNTSSLQLSSAKLHLSPFDIGLFGLIGAAGATAARISGKLADQGRQFAVSLFCAALIVVAFGLLYLFEYNLVVIVIAVLLLDFGVQGAHIANQSVIYAIGQQARSRITSIYMTSYFFGGAIGSFLSTLFFRQYGYRSVAIYGFAVGLTIVFVRFIIGDVQKRYRLLQK